MAYHQEAYASADRVIAGILAANGLDYTEGRQELARLFHEELWNGNWDCTTGFAEAGLEGLGELRLIQEDEYDQHMEDEHDSLEEDQIGYFAGHYVFTT